MVKLILRILGTLLGLAMIIPVIAPYVGWVTDWDTVSMGEKLLFGIVTGVSAGFGIAIIGLSTGLFWWILDQI